MVNYDRNGVEIPEIVQYYLKVDIPTNHIFEVLDVVEGYVDIKDIYKMTHEEFISYIQEYIMNDPRFPSLSLYMAHRQGTMMKIDLSPSQEISKIQG